MPLNQPESIPSTSSYVPPSENCENTYNETSNLLCLRPSPPPSPESQECEEPMRASKVDEKETQNSENDPGVWPLTFTDVDRTDIVIKGPIRIKVDFFPVNSKGRRFSKFHFSKILANGEKRDRRWMIYSQIKDAVFCFPCRIFGIQTTKFGSSEGVCDWKHLGENLKSHESSRQHKKILC